MTEKPKRKRRWFTLRELIVYTSLIGMVLGGLVAIGRIDKAEINSELGPLLGMFGMGLIALLGALLGLGVAVLVAGRHSWYFGCLLGLIALPLILYAFFILAMTLPASADTLESSHHQQPQHPLTINQNRP